MAKALEVSKDAMGRQVCGARLANTEGESQKFCMSTALMNNGKCELHRGSDDNRLPAQINVGRWAKWAKGSVLDKLLTRGVDEDLLSMEQEIGLIDSLIAELLEEEEEGTSSEIFLDIQEGWDAFVDARDAGDEMSMRRALIRVERAIERGKDKAVMREELKRLVDQRAKLVALESKLIRERKGVITLKEANALVARINAVINRHVKDVDIKRKIAADLRNGSFDTAGPNENEASGETSGYSFALPEERS